MECLSTIGLTGVVCRLKCVALCMDVKRGIVYSAHTPEALVHQKEVLRQSITVIIKYKKYTIRVIEHYIIVTYCIVFFFGAHSITLFVFPVL